MTQPLVTVLLVTYNHAELVGEALRGVLNQATDFQYEVIVSDDCSTDGTLAAIAGGLSSTRTPVKILHSTTNLGILRNFARGLAACHGQYVAICEGDDYWIDQYKLRRQIDALERYPQSDISFHSCYQQSGEKIERIICRARRSDALISARDVLSGGGAFMPTASILLRREVVAQLPSWFVDAPVADFILQAYGGRRGGACYIDRPMSVYRTARCSSWSGTMMQTAARLAHEKSFGNVLDLMAVEFSDNRDGLRALMLKHFKGLCYEGNRTGNPSLAALGQHLLWDRRHSIGAVGYVQACALQSRFVLEAATRTNLLAYYGKEFPVWAWRRLRQCIETVSGGWRSE